MHKFFLNIACNKKSLGLEDSNFSWTLLKIIKNNLPSIDAAHIHTPSVPAVSFHRRTLCVYSFVHLKYDNYV